MSRFLKSARATVVYNINILQVSTNFEIIRFIVEYEQGGSERAEYGKKTLPELSNRLTAEFGRGFSHSNLENMRRFYLEYYKTEDQISQTRLGYSLENVKHLINTAVLQKEEQHYPFTLSWSHYVFLLIIKNRDERRFYEIESTQNLWSLSELKRQFNSGLFERLALSRDTHELRKLADQGHIIEKPDDMIKDPYILEFLGLHEREHFSESDLETAIIDRLETF
ncbi:DUF1016 N-terminal domain-containing protein [Methanospirillum sp.]